jgi:phosphoserine phosphatase
MSKTLSPPTITDKPSRVSVPVTAEVLEAFQRLAKAGNMSTGRAMAQWLEDTVDAANYMAQTLEKARAAPKQVMAEIHAYALGLADETGDLLAKVRAKGRAPGTRSTGLQPGVSGTGAQVPPSCNTGGKLPFGTTSPRGGKSS